MDKKIEELKQLTGIYHEHQEGALCAQHALNNLLQNPVFSADELAAIAQELDIEEISVLTNGPIESENMDDTGFFSIQVLQRALKIADIELVPYASQADIAKQARANPENIPAYICNLGLHWFTLRRFGQYYFDLNSFFNVPELISNRKLTMYINLIKEKGYSIFIVNGNIPRCIADDQLTINQFDPLAYQRLTETVPKLVMDEKMLGNPKGPHKRYVTVTVPPHLYDEYKKNPNDPNFLRKLRSQIPQHILDEGFLETEVCNNPNCLVHHGRQMPTDFPEGLHNGPFMGDLGYSDRQRQLLSSTGFPEDFMDEESIQCRNPNCPVHHKMNTDLLKRKTDEQGTDNQKSLQPQSTILTEQAKQFMLNDPVIGSLTNPNNPPRSITTVTTQYAIRKPTTDNQNAGEQPPITRTTRLVIVSEHLSDEYAQTKQAIDNYRDHIQALEKRLADDIEQQDEKILQLAIAQSLRDTPGMNENKTIPTHVDHTEAANQLFSNPAISASLTSNNSVTDQPKETPELIPITTTTSPPTSTMNSEPITITNPPLATTTNLSLPIATESPSQEIKNPPSSAITESPSTTTTNLPVPTTPDLPSSTIHSSPPPTTTYSPQPSTATYSPPPTPTDSNSGEPSIEELRRRRLQNYNNRDRSIIGKQSTKLYE